MTASGGYNVVQLLVTDGHRTQMEENMRHYNRRDFLKVAGCSTLALPFMATSYAERARQARPNVLFIAVDDLRPELGCYGNTRIISPHIDRLARAGMRFDRAYCQQPICMASRASLMTGYRPDHAHIYNCDSVVSLIPNAHTLNKHFEQNGYQIWATGKIYHYGQDHEAQFGDRHVNPEGQWKGRGYLAEDSIRQMQAYAKAYDKIRGGDSNGRGPAFESPDVPDNAYADGARTDLAITQLRRFQNTAKPFFMAVGYSKPHLPFNAPKKYWDLYSEDDIQLADNPFLPRGATEFTPYQFGELRNYYGIPKDDKVLPDDLSRKLKHGYYACATYIDAQIGRLLDALDQLKMRDNTVIVLWGDHGWKLGEHGMWCKHTTFELDCRVPMILSVPGMKHAGAATQAMSEFVDIYPTLCQLCGLELPGHLQGDSLEPVLNDPQVNWHRAAFTVWPKRYRRDPDRVIMGYTIACGQYRYTEWTHRKSGQVLARELYDHAVDPAENENIVNAPGMEATVERMSQILDKGQGWRRAL